MFAIVKNNTQGRATSLSFGNVWIQVARGKLEGWGALGQAGLVQLAACLFLEPEVETIGKFILGRIELEHRCEMRQMACGAPFSEKLRVGHHSINFRI